MRDPGAGRIKIDAMVDREHGLLRIRDLRRADLFEFRDYRAGVVVRHYVTRPNRNKIPRANNCAFRKSIRVTRGNFFHQRQSHTRFEKLLLGGALAKELGDVEVDEIGVMKNDRLDGALDFVAFVTVGGDHVHDFGWNAMFVSERDAAERMSKLLAKFSLN